MKTTFALISAVLIAIGLLVFMIMRNKSSDGLEEENSSSSDARRSNTENPTLLWIVSDSGIQPNHWKEVVNTTPGVRLNHATKYVEDRFTDEPVEIASTGLDAEIKLRYAENVQVAPGLDPTHFWVTFFYYDEDKTGILFDAPLDLNDPTDQKRTMATILASKLGGRIVDKHGNVYDW